MAYAYVEARALPSKPSAQWLDVDLSNVLVYEIFKSYREIVLTLTLGGTTVYVDLNQLRAEYAAYNNTLSVLLLSIGARTLDHLDKIPGGKINYAVYTDAVRVGYRSSLTKIGVVLPQNFPKSELRDLELTRPKTDTDLSLIHTHCLASVNGMFHRTDTDGTRAFIVEGGATIQKKNTGHVGLTSFYDIGKLTKLKIDLATVASINPDSKLKDGLKFTVPESTEDKSFFLVLGGYLVFPHPTILWQSGLNEYQLNLTQLPYLERILESREFIDLSPLQLTESEINPKAINLEEVNSDAVVKRYLGLSQTFFVIVDRKDLFQNKRFLRQSAMPGLFTAYQEPTQPLIVGHGRAVEYWKVLEDGYWAVTAMDTWFRNYIFNRQDKDTLVNVTDQLAMDRPTFDSQGMLIEIGAPAETGVI